MLKKVLDKKCTRGYKFKVLTTPAGIYVGTVDEDGIPNCRVTGYFSTTKELENAPLQFRYCSENDFCHGGKGCLRAV